MEEKAMKAIQDDYPDDFACCYGCGRLNENGYHLRTGWSGENTVTIYTPRPEHTGGIPDFVYGGLLASLIDCHGTASASLYLHRKNGNEIGDGIHPPRFVTGTLNVDYKHPTPMGEPLKAIGTVEEIHPKKYKVYTEVFAKDNLVVTGEVVAVLMSKTFRKEALGKSD